MESTTTSFAVILMAKIVISYIPVVDVPCDKHHRPVPVCEYRHLLSAGNTPLDRRHRRSAFRRSSLSNHYLDSRSKPAIPEESESLGAHTLSPKRRNHGILRWRVEEGLVRSRARHDTCYRLRCYQAQPGRCR